MTTVIIGLVELVAFIDFARSGSLIGFLLAIGSPWLVLAGDDLRRQP